MKRSKLLLYALAGMMFTACDSGDIYPDDGPDIDTRTVSITMKFNNTETIPTTRERKLAFAAFEGEELIQPVRMQIINEADEDREFTLDLTQTPATATKAAVVIANQSSKVICVLYEISLPEGKEDVKLKANTINLANFARVQAQLFDQSCVGCHSGVNPSAKLNLEKGGSYDAIMGASQSGVPIVSPYNTSCYLVKKLTDEKTGSFHTTLTTLKDNDIQLLKSWIQAGAHNN